jgi:hypothetical protein
MIEKLPKEAHFGYFIITLDVWNDASAPESQS